MSIYLYILHRLHLIWWLLLYADFLVAPSTALSHVQLDIYADTTGGHCSPNVSYGCERVYQDCPERYPVRLLMSKSFIILMYYTTSQYYTNWPMHPRTIRHSEDVSPEAKGARLVESIEELLGPQFIRARHLALVMEKFPSECCVDKVPIFSTYRTDLVCTLFPRVKDLHNFELVLRVLKPHELAHLYARLGRLNLFNPMKPVCICYCFCKRFII